MLFECISLFSNPHSLLALHQIGHLLGAALRSDETLPLLFPPFVWKVLTYTDVTWADYATVDATVITALEDLLGVPAEFFEDSEWAQQPFTTALSSGRFVAVGRPMLQDRLVEPSTRAEYAAAVQAVRLTEFAQQMLAMREGLAGVVGSAVLMVLGPREVERRICGRDEIDVADLQHSASYTSGLSASHKTVQFLWQALANFSFAERSQFLRFVTGRQRLPVALVLARQHRKGGLPSWCWKWEAGGGMCGCVDWQVVGSCNGPFFYYFVFQARPPAPTCSTCPTTPVQRFEVPNCSGESARSPLTFPDISHL